MKQKTEYIKERISSLGLVVSEEQAVQFYQYYELLTEWNRFMNLTGITEFEEVVQKHFVDSLSLVWMENLKNVDNLIDVGTGAGFPGIPLKIAFPHLKVVLLDSLQKRITFLNEVIHKTGLTGIDAVHGRAEDYARPGKLRESFDLCVSRAVARLDVLGEYCLPYVKIGGAFIAYKSGETEQEIKDARSAVFQLGGKTEDCKNFLLPDSDIRRSLVKIKKVNGCPKKYPRKSGTAVKNPIK